MNSIARCLFCSRCAMLAAMSSTTPGDRSQAPIACQRCKATIDPWDTYCRNCGRRTGKMAWHHSPLFVVAMLFLVMGPIALPLLWRSPGFSKNWKIVLTALMVAYTVVIFYGLQKIYLQLTGLGRALEMMR